MNGFEAEEKFNLVPFCDLYTDDPTIPKVKYADIKAVVVTPLPLFEDIQFTHKG